MAEIVGKIELNNTNGHYCVSCFKKLSEDTPLCLKCKEAKEIQIASAWNEREKLDKRFEYIKDDKRK